MGFVDPGLGFYEAQSDGKGQAVRSKAIRDMMRSRD